MRFSTLPAGNRNYFWLCVSSWYCSSILFREFFPQTWIVSSQTCTDRYLAEDLSRTLYRSLFYPPTLYPENSIHTDSIKVLSLGSHSPLQTETPSRGHIKASVGFTAFISHLSGFTVFHCLLSES